MLAVGIVENERRLGYLSKRLMNGTYSMSSIYTVADLYVEPNQGSEFTDKSRVTQLGTVDISSVGRMSGQVLA